MKFLVATNRTQGDMGNDYTYCVPGELLWITDVCGRDRRDPNQGCGCGRGFGGLSSHRATTTAKVADLEVTEEALRLAVRTSLTDQGWLPEELNPADRTAIVEDVIAEVHAIVDVLPVGSVVRRDLDEFHAFPPPQQA
ncbi:MAG TPA: hypothetical protein VMT27_03175 [Actinomycetes bacterium]|nr:hypothetical protein [Actinomycetes bacterium]